MEERVLDEHIKRQKEENPLIPKHVGTFLVQHQLAVHSGVDESDHAGKGLEQRLVIVGVVVLLLSHDDLNLARKFLFAVGVFPGEFCLGLVQLLQVFVFLLEVEGEGGALEVINALLLHLLVQVEDGVGLIHQDILLLANLPELASLLFQAPQLVVVAAEQGERLLVFLLVRTQQDYSDLHTEAAFLGELGLSLVFEILLQDFLVLFFEFLDDQVLDHSLAQLLQMERFLLGSPLGLVLELNCGLFLDFQFLLQVLDFVQKRLLSVCELLVFLVLAQQDLVLLFDRILVFFHY